MQSPARHGEHSGSHSIHGMSTCGCNVDAPSCSIYEWMLARIARRGFATGQLSLVFLILIGVSARIPAKAVEIREGGPPGGTVAALLSDPKDSATIYAATDWSGIFKTTNGGKTWTATNTGIKDLAVYSLAITSSGNTTIYAGTRGGVFKSGDGGSTWIDSSCGLPKGSAASMITMLVIDPADPQTLYAGSFDSIFKTTNGAKTWTRIALHPRITQTSSYSSLALDPSHPATIYIAAGDRGLLKSADGGRVWKVITIGEHVERVLADPFDSALLYISTGSEILKSVDAGKHWRSSKSLSQTDILTMVADSKHPGQIYAGTMEGKILRSTDECEKWKELAAPMASEVHTLLVDPVHDDILYAGTSGGIAKSTDGGISWRPSNSGLANANISAIAIAPSQSATLYVGSYGGGMAKSSDGGKSWSPINAGFTGSFAWDIVIDPSDPARVYVGTDRGVSRSSNGGATWSEANRGLPQLAVCSLLIDPSNTVVLYATASSDGRAFKSTNAGDSWEEIPFGFPRLGGCGLVMNPANASVLYATSTAGNLKTTDGGKSWQKDNAGGTTFARLWRDTTSLAVDPFTPATVYAASSAGVFKSADRGQNWTVLSTAHPMKGLVRLLLDPSNPSVIYAEAEIDGLYKSTNCGESWKRIDDGLPDLSTRALVIDPTLGDRVKSGHT